MLGAIAGDIIDSVNGYNNIKDGLNMTIQRVKQEDETGCGLACIAMLAGVSYNEIKNVALDKLKFRTNGEFYTGTGQLKELASHYNVEIEGKRRRKFKSWSELPDVAIVSINLKENNKYWHWVVFQRKDGADFVLDPKKSITTDRRTNFNRMKPFGYLPVLLEIA